MKEKRKQRRALAVLTVLALICLTAVSASAEAMNITLGGAALEGGQASSVYFGKYHQTSLGSTEPADGTDGEDWVKRAEATDYSQGPYYSIDPIKWRVLSNGGETALLLSDKNLDAVKYHEDYEAVTWATSTVRSWLNGYGASANQNSASYESDNFIDTAFDETENEAIFTTTVVNDDNPSYGTEGGVNTSDKIFFLSIAEAMNTAYGFTSTTSSTETRRAVNTDYVYGGGRTGYAFTYSTYHTGYWWLCSPGFSTDLAAYVDSDGFLFTLGSLVYDDRNAVRPALNLNLSSVLFTSAAVGGKSPDGEAVGENFFANDAISNYTDSDGYKLTIKDDSRNFAVTGDCELAAEAGASVTFAYYGAKTGDGEYISAMIANGEDVLYYGQLSQPTSASGTVSLTVPTDIEDGTYTLKLFNEQINGDCKTDYSSDFVNISLTVSDGALPEHTILAQGYCGGEGDGTNLEYILYADGELVITGTGAMADYSSGSAPWYSYRSSVKSVSLGDGVTSIGSYAFKACSSLTSVEIPACTTSIGSNAFRDCSNLKRATIYSTTATFGSYVFDDTHADFEIHGYRGSTAEAYANNNGHTFVPIECVGEHNHVLDEDLSTAPTCTEDGTNVYVCTACGNSYEEDGDPALGHDMDDWEAVTPLCTETLTLTRECQKEDCDYDEQKIILPAGHSYESVVEKEATCTQNGIIIYTCIRCDDSYTIITYAEHSYTSSVIPATCTKDGKVIYSCECGDSYEEVIPGGHNYESEVTKKATTEEEGEITYTCAICGDFYKEVIPAYGTGALILLVQDTIPWDIDSNVKLLGELLEDEYIAGWDMVTTSKLSTEDLSIYNVIIIANDQTTSTYTRLGANSDKLTEYVENGGVIIYGACDHGWSGGDISYDIIGNVGKIENITNYNYIVDGGHPIVLGAMSDGARITNSLLYGTYCSHVSFDKDTLPENANIILQDSNGEPTLAEYNIGDGLVIATGLTWEFYYVRPQPSGGNITYSKNVFDDLILYAISKSGIEICEHNYEETGSVDATCTEVGYVTYTCTECGHVYAATTEAALGHDMGDWVETDPPKPGIEGEERRDCEREGCDYFETRPVDALPTKVIVNQGSISVGGITITWIVYSNGELVIEGDGGIIFGGSIPWEDYADSITTIIIKEGITYIDDYAFKDCVNLTEIEIPSTVTSIGKGAFYGCTSLVNIVIPESVTIINEYIFYGCTSLVNVTIQGNVTIIGDYAFHGCTSIVNITLPSSVTTINKYAFYGCTSLVNIVLPKNITVINEYAFYGCTSIVNITLPKNVTVINRYVFYGCTSLVNIVFEGDITVINEYAFHGCTSIVNIVFPESLTEIKEFAFYGCTSIINITLPKNITVINRYVFYGCTSLVNIVFEGDVTVINEYAFHGCTSIVNFIIPKTVTVIGTDAFKGCTNLVSVLIYSKNITFSGNVFANCHINLVITCYKNATVIITFAENYNIPYVFFDSEPGDADGNGEITIRDAAIILQYIAGWDVEVDENAADADGNGEITIRDAALILQYIAGWDVELG